MAQPGKAPQDTPDPANPQISIDANGQYTPSGGVTINPGGVVQLNVTFPTGMNTCTIPFGTIAFSNVPRPTAGGGNTVKVGS
jgi:hypothetical protein